MKKLLTWLLCLMMLVSAVPALAYTTGTYTGTGTGMLDKIEVAVTFDADTITGIEVVSCNDTPGVCDAAVEKIPAEIVKYQSLGVDVATSATFTSNGILEAVADAVKQAGGDVDALKAVPVEKVAGEEVKLSADVVVVGGGGAGLAAALTAAEEGASVIILEKGATYGGNTILSGGYYQAAHPDYLQYASLTEGQKEEIERYISLEPKDERMASWQAKVKEQYAEHLAAGHEYLFDSPELHMIQTYDGGDYLGDSELIEMMCYGDVDSMNWLSDHGFTWKKKTVAIVGSIWMRCKASDTYASGQGFINVISDAIQNEKLDVTTVFECRAEHLVKDDAGRVVGVTGVSTVDGTPYTVSANKGVIVASGGFSANVEMRQEYDEIWGNLTEAVPTTNAPTITGDGIVMAKAVGADLVGMGFAQLMPSSHPVDGSLFSGIWGSAETQVFVNKEGKRYVNEYAERDVLSKAALAQTDGIFYIICDNKIAKNADVAGMEAKGNVVVADTLEELAEKLGIPADTFVETIERYNSFVDAQKDDDFGKPLFGEKIDEAPFVATPRSPSLHHTMGGVKIDTNTHVISTEGNVIDGLYAAGEVTGGLHAGNRLGGNAMTDFLVFGRIAGENAAKAE